MPHTPKSRPHGSVIAQGRGKFLLRYTARDPRTGKRIAPAKAFTGTLKDARKELARWSAEGLSNGPAAPRALTLESVAAEWWTRPEGERTQRTYRDNYRAHIAPHFGAHRPVASITVRDVHAFTDRLRASTLSPRMQHHVFSNLRALLAYAVRCDYIAVNPCGKDKAPAPRVPQSEPKAVLSLEEAQRLVREAQAADDPLWLAVAILAATGIRPGELRALRWDDLEPRGADDWRLCIRSALSRPLKGATQRKAPKTNRARRIAIDPALGVALSQSRKGAAHTAPMFGLPTAPHKPLNEKSLNAAVRAAGARIGWPRLTPYMLRHSHLSDLVASGLPLPAISARAGHARVTTTLDRYSHARPGDESALVARTAGYVLPVHAA